ncbi:MAG: cytochrome C [Thiobacillaceae bacterium]|nr:cytochrome C [Thiobacillaceae bacterium]MCX7672347.1 cytochrome C [Thiobacillaceae bacterium]MDW8322475.1 cytochrome C' [Burkholderiales bacterium]
MKKLLPLALVSACLLAAPALAEDVLAKHKCNTCHDVAKKKMGPTWKEIAARATPADIKLALEKGVKGKYGKAAMPPQPKAVADTDAIVKAIQALK